MTKIRVYELAKKLNLSSKELLAKLSELGVAAKSHSSGVDKAAADKLLKALTKAEKPAGEKTAVKAKIAKPLKKEPKKPVIQQQPVSEKIEKKEIKKEPDKIAAREKIQEKIPPLETAPIPPAEEKKVTVIEEEEDLKLPDRFKKEVEAERISKFKGKPGMQRAFDTIKRVDTARKWHPVKSPFKKYDKRRAALQKTETKVVTLPTQPRKRLLKFQEGTTVKEFAELIGQKLPDVIKKFMELGQMPTINQPVDTDAAQIIAESYGLKIEPTHIETEETFLEEAE